MKNKTVTLLSQGCRLNHSETAGLINDFRNAGIEEVSMDQNPDIVIINTCTVTENGDKDTQKLLRKINQTCKNTKVALIGCQSQIKKAQLLKLPNVQWVIGNEEKKNTKNIVLGGESGVHVGKISNKPFFQTYSSFDPRHTRVNLKIQDGCDFYCAFCIIPFARGPARSRNFDNIIEDARSLIGLGVKELVLTGINLGTYENSGINFYELLETLLNLNLNTRIRISSIEPTTIGGKLIELWEKHPNFCRYLHLPIQSGTNEILTLMRRKYSIEVYDDYIKTIKSQLPEICIGTDVIVGFPGETDALFEKTVHYLNNAPIDYFHVFSYSERTMAHSRKFEHPVDKKEIKRRSEILRHLHAKKWADYLHNEIGKKRSVLFEQKKGDDWIGSTEHFVKVRLKSNENLKNNVVNVKLKDVRNQEMVGELA